MLQLEFRKLEKPVTVDKPVKATFDEVWVSGDVRWNFFLSVTESIRTYFSTPDAITLFALRELLQNAIDQEIMKNPTNVNEIINAYRKVKFRFTGTYYIVESEGDLPEEAFELGYTTKLNVKLPNRCCLIGRFGIGFKQAIGALKQQGFNTIIQTAGHVYTYAGLCGDKLELEKITGDCRIAILRGKSDVKGKTIVYAEGVEIKTNLLWDEELRVSPTGEKVYHNGLYSGKWGLPFSVNLCCVSVDEYRTKVTPYDERMSKILEEFFNSLTPAERSLIIKSIRDSYVLEDDMVYFDYPGMYNNYFTFKDIIAEALMEIAKDLNINIIVIGNTSDTKDIKQINIKPFIFKDLSLFRAQDIVNEIKKKGGKAYTFTEYKKLVSTESLIKSSLKPEEIPEPIKKGILAGRWAYSVAYRLAVGLSDITRLLNMVETTEIYVIPDTFGEWNNADLGITMYTGKSVVFLAPPSRLTSIAEDMPFSDKDYALFFVTMSVVFHELNHVENPLIEHGTFTWERVYYQLLALIQQNTTDTKFLANVINLAYYNPELLEGVKEIRNMELWYFSPDVFVELKTSNEVYVTIENDRVEPEVPEKAQFKLKAVKTKTKYGDDLTFVLDSLPRPAP